MRTAAEGLLASYENFSSFDGTAESTTVATDSVDLVVVGQAFHWFDPPKARAEFARILKPGGHVALIWNSRLRESAFMRGYEDLLFAYADDYKHIGERNVNDEVIAGFYAPQVATHHTLGNEQRFDFAGLRGRALSSSYSPAPEHPQHEAFVEALQKLFDEHQVEGTVRIEYKTRIYWGTLTL